MVAVDRKNVWGDDRIDWGIKAEAAFDESIGYRDGGNCVFFAVQEANEHFLRGGFGEDEFARFRKGYDDLFQHEQEVTGKKGRLRHALGLSVQLMIPWLREKFIDVTGVYLTKVDIDKMLKAYPDLKDFPFHDATNTTTFVLPSFVFTERPGSKHVFFAKDKKDFIAKKKIHMDENRDTIIGFMTAERAKQQ